MYYNTSSVIKQLKKDYKIINNCSPAFPKTLILTFQGKESIMGAKFKVQSVGQAPYDRLYVVLYG